MSIITNKPLTAQSGELPPDVQGIAQLEECNIIELSPQSYWFVATGYVLEPKEYRGCQTSIRVSLDDDPRQKRTLEERLRWTINELRKLGADLTELDTDELPKVIAALRWAQPQFRFRTWKGRDSEYVNHVWEGVIQTEQEPETPFIIDPQ